MGDKSIKTLVRKLQYYYKIFNRLCNIFKCVEGSGKNAREHVEKKARRFLNEMKNKSRADSEFKKIVSRLEKFWNGLFFTYEFEYIPSINNDMEGFIKDFKKMWKRITGFYNVNRWISFHGPFAIYLFNFKKNGDGISPFDLLGVETPDFSLISQKVSKLTYESERAKQEELRTCYRVRLRVSQTGIQEYIDDLVKDFENEVNIKRG